ncbi:MAG: glycosyltransferase [Parachlamydiaceae bacterium]
MEVNNPLVSIVIPIYNHEAYVEEALSSVFYQTYENLEIILIDDGSKDRSVEVVEDWLNKHKDKIKNRHFSFIKQTNQGAHNTINRGLHLAKGDFLTILNSDDFYHLKRIELLVKKAQQEHGELIFSRVHAVDEDGKSAPRGNWWWIWYERAMLQLALLPTVGFKLLQDNITVSTGNLFFSRQLFHQIGDFKDFKLAHDYDFVMRALALTEPLLVTQELYFYRLHSDNTVPKVIHLIEQELCEIYRSYLSLTYHPPKNRLAPCHHYWPVAFSMHRQRLALDRSLSIYLEQRPKQTSEVIIKKSNLPEGAAITLISHSLSVSGGPKLLCDMAIALKENGYCPKVLAFERGPLQELLNQYNIPVRVVSFPFAHIPQSKIKKGWLALKIAFALWKDRSQQIIGNTSLSWPGILIGSLAFPKKKFYWYIHESCRPEAMIKGKFASKLFQKIKTENKVHFWFGSKATKHMWEKSGIEGETAYWSGVPSRDMKEREKQPMLNILSIGAGEPRKGFHYLLEAFIHLIKEKQISDQATLTLVGFTHQLVDMQTFYSDLILKALQAGVKDRVHFLLKVDLDQLDDLYENSDLYVQASTMECLPLSLLQAMSKGLPIITSDVYGCTEAIEDQVTGYIFPSRNPKKLAECIAYALTHPQESQKMGLNALKKFKRFYAKEINVHELLRRLKQN